MRSILTALVTWSAIAEISSAVFSDLSLAPTAPKDGKAYLFNRENWLPLDNSPASTRSDGKVPMPPIFSGQDFSSSAQIFVAVVSYRDEQCGATIKSIFSNARHPDRIVVGIVEQKQTDDLHCLDAYCRSLGYSGRKDSSCPRLSQIEYILTSAVEARGASFARAMSQQMIADEEFCLEIDAHSSLTKNWDDDLIDMWSGAGNEFAVLSTQPQDVTAMKSSGASSSSSGSEEAPVLCHHYFTDSGLPNIARPTWATRLKTPLLTASWSGAFSFSKCHLTKRVPFDGSLVNVYDGVDFTRYARMWTHGYDVYAPPRNVIYHDYHASDKRPVDPREWIEMGMSKEFVRLENDFSRRRMGTILGMPSGDPSLANIMYIGSYGLGSKRSLDQFIAFTGVDTRSGAFHSDACKQLQWVAYEMDPDPRIERGSLWGMDVETEAWSLIVPPALGNAQGSSLGNAHSTTSTGAGATTTAARGAPSSGTGKVKLEALVRNSYKAPSDSEDSSRGRGPVSNGLFTTASIDSIGASAGLATYVPTPLVYVASMLTGYVNKAMEPFVAAWGVRQGTRMFQLVVATLPVLFLILGFSVYSIIADNSAYADATSSSTKREGRSSTTSSTSSSRGVVSPTATRPVDDAKLSSLDKIA